MDEQTTTIDANGRYHSGSRFQALAGEHAGFLERLRTQWAEGSPLPYEEFALPYLELRNALLENCARLGVNLSDAGNGQVVMAGQNVDVEQVNTANVACAGQVRA
ncbi:hypothetical protein [Actinoallomurus acaciae]|uniref:Uncharacterized protein n=1 Tax=Actinoallomurus acaciae TaxID=502577 RepID=A0ABV5YBZ0_9ACTN